MKLNDRYWPEGDAGRKAERMAALYLSGRILDFRVLFGYKINYGAF